MTNRKKAIALAFAVPLLAILIIALCGMAENTVAQNQPASITDPCFSQFTAKSSVPINATTATTTQLVAPAAGEAVFVCGASLTIAPSSTSADTAQFISGTGPTCGTNTVTNTGTFGNGDLTTAAPPLFISFADPGSTFSSAVGAGVCLVSAGTTVNIQGVLTYVQQ